jgi:hypothetical protein
MRKLFVHVLVLTICFSAISYAQDRTDPMLDKGVRELGLIGVIDLLGEQGDVDVLLNASYGYFMSDGIEVGPYFSYSRSNDGDVMNYSLGVFGEYHLSDLRLVNFAASIPYVGASIGLDFLDSDINEDESAITFVPQIGIKWFFRNYVAVDTNFYFATATDDIFVNDNDADDYDFGIRLGLRVLFK